MSVFSRALLSIKRRPWRTMILFLSVLLLATLTAGAISVSQGITQTDLNLRRQLPAITTLVHDEEALDAYLDLHGYIPWDRFNRLTPEEIETIGTLSYVQAFDYAILEEIFFSDQLHPVRNIEPYLATWMETDIIHEHLAGWPLVEGLNSFTLKGVYELSVLDVESGLIRLLQGQVFSEAQEVSEAYPSLISEAFAEANGLTVGSNFTLDMRMYDFDQEPEEVQNHLLVEIPISFEVIGIFEPTVEMSEQVAVHDIFNHMALNARIYVPISVMIT